MSATDSTEKENWVLFQTKYEYMALPVSLATEVMKYMIVMKKETGFELSDDEISIRMLNADAMTVARVKAKMKPKEEEE